MDLFLFPLQAPKDAPQAAPAVAMGPLSIKHLSQVPLDLHWSESLDLVLSHCIRCCSQWYFNLTSEMSSVKCTLTFHAHYNLFLFSTSWVSVSCPCRWRIISAHCPLETWRHYCASACSILVFLLSWRKSRRRWKSWYKNEVECALKITVVVNKS